MSLVEGACRPSGYLLLRKPVGVTSYQALSPVKKRLGTSKVGHAGTLDRFASGLLVVLAGSYSRLNEFVSSGEKVYRGTVRFGVETNTLDPEGEVVAEAAPPERSAIEAVLPRFKGSILQRPPVYSALHVDGKRAYERALAGEEIAMPERPVMIDSLEIESYDGRDAILLVRCGPGTYIRSLARDIALACGSRASLVALERLAIGPFRLEDSVSSDEFEATRDLHRLSVEEAEKLGLGILGLNSSDSARFKMGALIATLRFEGREGKAVVEPGHPAAVFDPSGSLLGVIELKGDTLSYRLVLGEGA